MAKPNLRATKEAVAVARARAEALAAVFEDVAVLEAATDVHRMTAQTARDYLKIANCAAGLFPAVRHREILAELADLEDRLAARIKAIVLAEFASGAHLAASPAVQLAIAAAIAETETAEAAVRLERAQHKLGAWLAACDALAALRRPAAALAPGPGTVQ